MKNKKQMTKVHKNYRITIYSRRGKVNRKVMAFEFLDLNNPEFDCALKRFKSKRELTRDFINGISCELYHEFYEFFKDVPGYETWSTNMKNVIDCLNFIVNHYTDNDKFVLEKI